MERDLERRTVTWLEIGRGGMEDRVIDLEIRSTYCEARTENMVVDVNPQLLVATMMN